MTVTFTHYLKTIENALKAGNATEHTHRPALKTLLEEDQKQKALERALTMTDLESFDYSDYNSRGGAPSDTEQLAKETIKWFMLGYCFRFSSRLCTRRSTSISEEDEQAFRAKFKAQIKTLIQREPRMVQNNDNTFTIFYS